MQKKVLFFAGGSAVYGMEIVIATLMAELNKMGAECHAVISGWNNADYPTRLSSLRIKYTETKLGRFYLRRPRWTLTTLRYLPGALKQLKHLYRTFDPDYIIHTDPYAFRFLYSFSAKRPTSFYLHNPPYGRHWLIHQNYLVQNRTRVICVSHFLKRELVEAGYPASLIDVVYNGLPQAGSTDMTAVAPQSRKFRLVIVGQVIPRKRHDIALKALSLLVPRYGNEITLTIFGEKTGAYAQSMFDLSERLGISNNVHWNGYEPDREVIYREADALLVPAVKEPFGLTIIEAASFGVPAIASASGAFPELIADGTTGILFRADDPSDLAASIARLMNDAEMRRQMGAAVRGRASRFSAASMAHDFAAVLWGHRGPQRIAI